MLTDISKIIESSDKPSNDPAIVTPISLDKVGSVVVIEKGYEIHIEPHDTQNFIIVAGFDVTSPGFKFSHPNIESVKTIHHYKHYWPNGRKSWTQHAGIDHFIAIPKKHISLLPKKGYSYIPANINGVDVHFNVSGGGGETWVDYLHPVTHVSCNISLHNLKKLIEVSIPMTIDVKEDEDFSLTQWQRLVLSGTPYIKNVISKMIEEKKNPLIHLEIPYTYAEQQQGYGIDVVRRWKKIPNQYMKEAIGAPKAFIVDFGIWSKCRVKVTQIDWIKTAQLNNINIPYPSF